MKVLQYIVDNMGVICALLITLINAIVLIVSKVSSNKKGKVIEGITDVINSLPDLIKTAEKVANSGEERKVYVMNQVVLLCKSLGFNPTEEHISYFNAITDNLVALSKSINLYSNEPKTTLIKTLGVNHESNQ